MYYNQNLLFGAVLILTSELMFSTMGALVKAISAELPSEMAVFMRNFFGLLVLTPWVLRKAKGKLSTSVFHLHLLRACIGLAAMYCFFYALGHLPLAEGLLLKMTAPLFMPFIAFLWLRERAPTLALVALPVGFLGVALVLNPHGDFNWIALIGLFGGMFAALAKVTVRRLGRSEPTIRVVFYFSLITSVISAIPLAWAWQTPQMTTWGLLVLMGIMGTLGQVLLTRGYAVAQAAQIAPFTYFSIIYGACYGYIFWDETLSLSFVAGALLIALAGLLALRKPRQFATAEATDFARL